jgi:hypothetical protein
MNDNDRQLGLDDIEHLSPTEIDAALASGRLDDLLSGDRPKQLSRAELKSMSSEQIARATREGRLSDLLRGKEGETAHRRRAEAAAVLGSEPTSDKLTRLVDGGGQITREQLAAMSPEATVAALAGGRLDDILGRKRA